MKILNFGSLNIDYVYQVDDFVRAGETKLSQKREVFAGGKGLNQSIALAKAGIETYHAGSIGSEGEFLRRTMERAGVDVRWVRTLQEDATGHAMIQVNEDGQNCILLYGGANQRQDEDFVLQVLENFGAGDLLLLQNEINHIPFLMQEGKRRGMKIAFNPSPINEQIDGYPLELVDIFLVNEIEGKALGGGNSFEETIGRLLGRFPDSGIVMTLGSEGVLYRSKACSASQGIFSVNVVDTTAAGDTFTGYFLAALAEGKTVQEALRRGCAASAICVSRPGASPAIPSAKEVEQMLQASL